MVPYRTQVEVAHALFKDMGAARELHGVLRAEHFANPALGLVAEAILQQTIEQGSAVTEGQVQHALDQTAGPLLESALGALATVLEASAPPTSYAVEVGRHMAAEAELTRLAKEVEFYASEGKFDPFVEEARKIAAIACGTGTSFTGMGDIEGRHQPNRIFGISSGVPRLDQALGGHGWLPGQLVLILAPDGGGKTQTTVSFGTVALLAGLRVHHTTLEIEARGHDDSLGARYDRSISGVGSRDFWVRLPEVREQIASVEERLTILEAVSRPLTVSALEAEVLRLEHKPDLLIIDSGYLMSSGNKYAGDGAAQMMRNDLSDLHQRLRILGQRLRCPVITPFQCNREGLKKMSGGRNGPDLPEVITRADMADALSVSRHADIVISVNQNTHEHASGTGRLWLDKARGGHQFQEIACRFAWDRSRVRDIQEVNL